MIRYSPRREDEVGRCSVPELIHVVRNDEGREFLAGDDSILFSQASNTNTISQPKGLQCRHSPRWLCGGREMGAILFREPLNPDSRGDSVG
jgi:hypothetical protein